MGKIRKNISQHIIRNQPKKIEVLRRKLKKTFSLYTQYIHASVGIGPSIKSE